MYAGTGSIAENRTAKVPALRECISSGRCQTINKYFKIVLSIGIGKEVVRGGLRSDN